MIREKNNTKKTYIIAEIGLNHNGDFGIAAEMIKKAVEAGVDAVKFQNYKTEDFIVDKSLACAYKSMGKTVREPVWNMCKRCELDRKWLPELKKLCDSLGIEFFSTPTSEEGVKDLIDIGVRILKNGSDYLSHLKLLRYMGSTGLPIIISTGMAYEKEIEEAVNAVREGGGDRITLLHCTSLYPTMPCDVNLRRMVALKERFGLPVGFSDHTMGSSAAVQAVTLDASVIEKHFTMDHDMAGPDHWFSLTPSEFGIYVKDIRDAEKRLGRADIKPASAENKNRKECRLSVVAARDIMKGRRLRREDIAIAKPGTGLPPKEAERVEGRVLIKNIAKGTPFRKEYFI